MPSASPPAAPAGPGTGLDRRARRRRVVRAVQAVISIGLAVAIFALVIPKIADYRDVWATVTGLTWLEFASLVVATALNLFTYWWQMVAAMPGLTFAQAAVNNQSSTTIANVLPGGGAIANVVAIAMFRSWGFSKTAITLELTLTGAWNSFLKLGLPVIALVLVTVTGHATASLLVPALLGLAFLAGSLAVFALALWRSELARRFGAALGRAWSGLRRVARRPPVTGWDEGAVRFRRQTIALLERRWVALTLSTLASHLALYIVLLLALRHVGVSEQEVSWTQVLAVFSFGRLVTAVPLTPGGLGVVELAYISGLVLAGRHHADVAPDAFRAQVAAAVLLFRTLTYGVQIPLGAFTYAIWRANRRWQRPSDAVSDETTDVVTVDLAPEPEPTPATAAETVLAARPPETNAREER
jgi:uncharacterized membrane protein YbhN (UPF0104 family)